MFGRVLNRLAIAACSITLYVTAAAADPRVIVFGDSLSDNGNLFAATQIDPNGPTPTSPPYFNGRFSNGPVWVEQLFDPMGGATPAAVAAANVAAGGNINFAFGGARTDSIPHPDNAAIPGVSSQISLYQAYGGYFAPDYTVVLLAGANNIFQFFDADQNAIINGGTAIVPTEATITANSVAAATANIANIQRIAQAGAGRILVSNLPNIGAAPAFNGTVAGSQGAFLATQVYNQVQAAGVQQIAAAVPGVNIIQMDLNSVFNVIQANPAAFGFTNVTQACFVAPDPGPPVVVGSLCATPNQYLFWDGVHPTEPGHALIAQYAGLLLDTSGAQAAMAPLAESALWANSQATNSIMDRMQGFISSQYSQRQGLHADILGTIGSQDARGLPASLTPAYDYNLYGIRGGFDRKFGTSLYGASATILRGNLSSSNLKADTTNFQADVYGSWSFGNMFVNADVGAGFTHIANIHRQTGFPTVETTANVNNLLVHGAVQAGYIAKLGPISLMPTARMQVINSNLGSVDESAPILAMQFDSRNTTAVLGGVKLRASMNTGAITLFAEVGYEDYLSYSSSNITAKLANNTADASTISVADPDAGGLTLAAGVNGAITPNMLFDAQYGLALQNGNGQTHSGKLRVKVPF